MRASELHLLWIAPDRQWLSRKQFSFRLPLPVVAQLSAIAEMYPHRRRNQLIGDLLLSALEEFEQSLPHTVGTFGEIEAPAELMADAAGEPSARLYLSGVRAHYRALANKHFRQLESESGAVLSAGLFQRQVAPRAKDGPA